ncbi:hypothetical protein Y032_0012g1648 [Ancylostoma ceylanicum]|uniref:Uncharacterized protein n=1 Tax=Ancylostoma ceylanicum TaxID=53326 RepID=A0A016VCP9_9BILA|nr:hypothetical protein Y032_0012g1648 [Ancylostoma ceylanicum]
MVVLQWGQNLRLMISFLCNFRGGVEMFANLFVESKNLDNVIESTPNPWLREMYRCFKAKHSTAQHSTACSLNANAGPRKKTSIRGKPPFPPCIQQGPESTQYCLNVKAL